MIELPKEPPRFDMSALEVRGWTLAMVEEAVKIAQRHAPVIRDLIAENAELRNQIRRLSVGIEKLGGIVLEIPPLPDTRL